jgi:hypothetical protein
MIRIEFNIALITFEIGGLALTSIFPARQTGARNHYSKRKQFEILTQIQKIIRRNPSG